MNISSKSNRFDDLYEKFKWITEKRRDLYKAKLNLEKRKIELEQERLSLLLKKNLLKKGVLLNNGKKEKRRNPLLGIGQNDNISLQGIKG